MNQLIYYFYYRSVNARARHDLYRLIRDASAIRSSCGDVSDIPVLDAAVSIG